VLGRRLKDSQAAKDAWFGISCFKPLSPFSLMKYCTMLGSRGNQQTMKPQEGGAPLADEEKRFCKICIHLQNAFPPLLAMRISH